MYEYDSCNMSKQEVRIQVVKIWYSWQPTPFVMINWQDFANSSKALETDKEACQTANFWYQKKEGSFFFWTVNFQEELEFQFFWNIPFPKTDNFPVFPDLVFPTKN